MNMRRRMRKMRRQKAKRQERQKELLQRGTEQKTPRRYSKQILTQSSSSWLVKEKRSKENERKEATGRRKKQNPDKGKVRRGRRSS